MGVGAGLSIKIAAVGGLTGLLTSAWDYDAPSILSVSPSMLLPVQSTVLTITGLNFGSFSTAGAVTIAGRSCDVSVWNDTVIECLSPVGVAATTRVSLVVSGQTATVVDPSVSVVQYQAPHVTSFTPNVSSTTGGGNLTIFGTAFAAASPLVVTVSLVRAGHASLDCTVVSVDEDVVVCTIPVGSGRDWTVVVTNTDPTMVNAPHQSSSAGGAPFSYLSPTIRRVEQVPGQSPAVGGFPLVVIGDNLSLHPRVFVGATVCPPSSVPGNDSYTVCMAPGWSLLDVPTVSVVVDGLVASGPRVVYDAPEVLSVSPSTVLPQEGSPPVLVVTGRNFGLPPPGAHADSNYSVDVGPLPCTQVHRPDDGTVVCTLAGQLVVGTFPVALLLGDAVYGNDSDVAVSVLCPYGTYGVPGGVCQQCPAGSSCSGGWAMPAAVTGYYPLSATEFVPCEPADACLGGPNGTCSSLYTGPLCGDCATGAYRCVGGWV